MTRAEARTAIKTATDHDGASDTQVSTTQLDTWIDEEHKLFRRQLSAAVPWLYTAVGNEETLAAGDDTLTIPNDFERLYRLGNTVLVVTHEDDIAHHARRIVHLRDGLVEYDEPVTTPLLAGVPEEALGGSRAEA